MVLLFSLFVMVVLPFRYGKIVLPFRYGKIVLPFRYGCFTFYILGIIVLQILSKGRSPFKKTVKKGDIVH